MNSQKQEMHAVLEPREDVDRRLGKLVNRLRLSGFVTMIIAIVVCLTLSQSTHPQSAIAIQFLIAFGAAAFGVAIASEAFWRVLRQSSSLDEREF